MGITAPIYLHKIKNPATLCETGYVLKSDHNSLFFDVKELRLLKLIAKTIEQLDV